MSNKFGFILITITVLLTSCHRKYQNPVDLQKIGKVKLVVILGNSIVRHPPAPSIGWNNDWGMAASCIDSDFVHLLIKKINDPYVVVKFLNISDFESHYTTYDITKLDSLKGADLLIIKLAENVKDQSPTYNKFIPRYNDLINNLKGVKTTPVLVDGFWINKHVNADVQKYAQDHQYPFINITDLCLDSTNSAIGKFKNEAINAHPSDKGMRKISERIWEYLNLYFVSK